MPEEKKILTTKEEAEAKAQAVTKGASASPNDKELSTEDMNSLTAIVEGNASSAVNNAVGPSASNLAMPSASTNPAKPSSQKSVLGKLGKKGKEPPSDDGIIAVRGRVYSARKNQVLANDDELTYEKKVLKRSSFRLDRSRPVIIGGNSRSGTNSRYYLSKEELGKNYPLPKKYGLLEFNLDGYMTNDISMFFSKMYNKISRLELGQIPHEYLFVTKRQNKKKVYGCYYLFESPFQSIGVINKIYEYQELGTVNEYDTDGIVDVIKKVLPAYASKLKKPSLPVIIVESSIKSKLVKSLGSLEEVFEHELGKYIGYKEEGHFK